MPASRKSPNRKLMSTGYEGRDVEQFIACLAAHDVKTLVDVRLNAISRKSGFSKTALRLALQKAGIEYEHLRALGNPRDNRDSFRAGEQAGRERYRQVLASAEAHAEMEKLVELTSDTTVALLCLCADHDNCHRSLVAEELRARSPDLEIVPV